MEQQVSFVKNGLLAALFFGVPMGAFAGLLSWSPITGLVGGVGAGALFGLAVGVLGKLQSRALATPGGVDEAGDKVLFAGPANHWMGIEGVAGKLSLTAKQLRFRAHTLNVQAHDGSYALDAIARVEATRTLWIIPNGLLVFLNDGRRERFVVRDRGEWIQRIRGAIEARGYRD